MVLLILTFLLFSFSSAEAITLTESGATLTLEYDEPTTDDDLEQLHPLLIDLDHTNIYIDDTLNQEIPATSNAGGGHITATLTVPVLSGQIKTIKVHATAVDTSGNESDPSTVITKIIDRLAPSPPQ